jgi:hypothetical protein
MDKGKAWMVMQKRTSGSLTFWNRTFEEFAQGFGDPSLDSWLGLRKIRQMINSGKRLQLQVEIEGNRCDPAKAQEYYFGLWNFAVNFKCPFTSHHLFLDWQRGRSFPLEHFANYQWQSYRSSGQH